MSACVFDHSKFVLVEANLAGLPMNSVRLSHIAKTIRKYDICRIELDCTGVASLGDAIVSSGNPAESLLIDTASIDTKLRHQTIVRTD
jgi:hypothetical protein